MMAHANEVLRRAQTAVPSSKWSVLSTSNFGVDSLRATPTAAHKGPRNAGYVPRTMRGLLDPAAADQDLRTKRSPSAILPSVRPLWKSVHAPPTTLLILTNAGR